MVHATDPPAGARRSDRTETRRRVRIAIVVYGLALTGLLLAAAYVAPASALDASSGANGAVGARAADAGPDQA